MAAREIGKEPTTLKPIYPAPIINNATPKPAPELIPNRYGPASGFLKRVCIRRPETAKAAPANKAAKALGILASRMMILSERGISFPRKMSRNEFKGIFTEPIKMSINKRINRDTPNSRNRIVDRFPMRFIRYPVFYNTSSDDPILAEDEIYSLNRPVPDLDKQRQTPNNHLLLVHWIDQN